MLSYPVTPNSPPQLPLPVFTSSLSDESSSRTLAVVPRTRSPDSLLEYAAALKWGEKEEDDAAEAGAQVGRNGSGSSTSYQTRSLTPCPQNDTTPQTLTPNDSGFAGYIEPTPIDLFPGDRSESSHQSHHTYLTHYSQHSSPHYVHPQQHQYFYQRPASAMAAYSTPNTNPRRTPSPTTYFRSSSQQSMYPTGPAPGHGGGGSAAMGSSSSWHGHTMLTLPPGLKKSWHGASHVSPLPLPATLTQPPPSSWNSGHYAGPSAYWTPPPSNGPRPQLSPVTTRFYIPADTTPPTPVLHPQPPSPRPLTPPRKLTCTNPDETRSLAESSKKSRPSTPEPL